jgi:hypothetical protein
MSAADPRDELIARARERADTPAVPVEWGYRVVLDNEEEFVGRWRGETTDPDNADQQGNPRAVYLLWDEQNEPCYSRTYAALGREIRQAAPNRGDRICIYRGDDYTGAQGAGYSFGVVVESCDEPLPGADDDDIPF